MAISIFTQLSAQGLYDLRLVNVQEADCENDVFYIDIQIKAASPSDTFRLSAANYRFNFDTQIINNPRLETELANSGLEIYPDNSYSLYSPHSINTSIGILSYNYLLEDGVGHLVSNDWLSIGRIAFDIVNNAGCATLIWNNQSQHPNTFVSAIHHDGSTYEVDGNNYINSSVCINIICPICPASLTFSGVIPNGSYLASQTIEVDGTMQNNGNLSLKAGQLIILEKGFSVEPLAIFSAEIEGCGINGAHN